MLFQDIACCRAERWIGEGEGEIGVEETSPLNYNLVVLGDEAFRGADIPSYIYFDRCYIHGNASGAHIRRGIALNATFISVTDSYVDNFHDDSDSRERSRPASPATDPGRTPSLG